MYFVFSLFCDSGAIYNLHGPIDETKALQYFPPSIVNAFRHGFPESWHELLFDYTSNCKDESDLNNRAQAETIVFSADDSDPESAKFDIDSLAASRATPELQSSVADAFGSLNGNDLVLHSNLNNGACKDSDKIPQAFSNQGHTCFMVQNTNPDALAT
jgi:hypothetical protein